MVKSLVARFSNGLLKAVAMKGTTARSLGNNILSLKGNLTNRFCSSQSDRKKPSETTGRFCGLNVICQSRCWLSLMRIVILRRTHIAQTLAQNTQPRTAWSRYSPQLTRLPTSWITPLVCSDSPVRGNKEQKSFPKNIHPLSTSNINPDAENR